MILGIVSAKVMGYRQMDVCFNNGIRKPVDVTPLLEGPIFEPLHSPRYFERVELDEVCGTVVWPNGADFAPESLLNLLEVNGDKRRRVPA